MTMIDSVRLSIQISNNKLFFMLQKFSSDPLQLRCVLRYERTIFFSIFDRHTASYLLLRKRKSKREKYKNKKLEVSRSVVTRYSIKCQFGYQNRKNCEKILSIYFFIRLFNDSWLRSVDV